ncbi:MULTISPECIES: chromate transporter [Bacillus]|uniref:chromate transporter n=1 Tax=Bacillus TaxID=1386 RepID=UPI0015835B81|nr:chromate transporter [Bacillus glycinifermentans]MBU8787447.1 chromate transporter [Bacillus glycinifermentans]NUJ16408.1 chromate transporter [Bacillus glycinifermentans]
MKHPYRELIIAMMRAGILGFGGGPSVIPLIRHEAVTKFKWIDDGEFGEILALANALPGPIATKMSAYLGYKIKSIPGAVVATAAHILPTCTAMAMLFAAVNVLSHSKVVNGMIGAVTPVIAVMLGQMAYEFGQKALKGFGIVTGVLFFIIAFLGLQVFSIHSGIVVTVFLAYGAFHFKLKRKAAERKDKGVSAS